MFQFIDSDDDNEITVKEAMHLWRFLGYDVEDDVVTDLPRVHLQRFLHVVAEMRERAEADFEGSLRALYRMMDPLKKDAVAASDFRDFMGSLGTVVEDYQAIAFVEDVSRGDGDTFTGDDFVFYMFAAFPASAVKS
eukprot:PLAT3926.1.p2 GENE.PLAT3926.1~~PLAT3926.1.p2  ORF type:complete len:136 (-),score=47.92 PLAT3926.1:102-509(-)